MVQPSFLHSTGVDVERVESVAQRLAQDPGLIARRDEQDMTLLARAVQRGSVEVAKYLIAQGADLTTTCSADDDAGLTLLHLAVQSGAIGMVALLAERGLDVNAATSVKSVTPMAMAVDRVAVEIARFLVNHGARPVLEFPVGFSPSPWAAKFFQDQLAYRTHRDWDGLIRDLWCDDCQLLAFNFDLRGKEAIKQHFIEGSPLAGKLLAFSVQTYNESKDAIVMRSTVLSEFLLVKATDSYLFRDGKVLVQTALAEEPEKIRSWALKWLAWDAKFDVHLFAH